MKTAFLPYLWLLFPPGFAALWLGISALISLAGWRTLSRDFATQSAPQGPTFALQSAEIGGGRYSGCLKIVAAPDGLYLRPYFPFRFQHPPLVIPYSAFQNRKSQKVLWGQQWTAEIQTANRQRTPVVFAREVGAQIEAMPQNPAASAPIASPWS